MHQRNKNSNQPQNQQRGRDVGKASAAAPASGVAGSRSRSSSSMRSSSRSRSFFCCSWLCLALLPVALVALYIPIDTWATNKPYVFTQEGLAEIAREASSVGGNPEEIMDRVTSTLLTRFPDHIQDTEWIFMRAGGWMGAYKLLYASMTEYVLLFGTGVDTSGHSGRYLARIEDTILTGRFVQWQEGKIIPLVHGPGVTVIHEKYEATGVQWDSGTWMLEHFTGGLVGTALPFAFSDGIFSAQDFYALYRGVVVYAKLVIKSLIAGRL